MATGDTLASWDGAAAFFPSSNSAGRDVTGAGVPVVEFDDSSDESCYFQDIMPGQYDGTTGLTVRLFWKFSSLGSSYTMEWEVSFARIEDDTDSIESLTFASAQAVVATEPSASGEIDYTTISFSNAQADGVQPNEKYVIRVTRDASEGTGSGASGDAQLVDVEIALQ